MFQVIPKIEAVKNAAEDIEKDNDTILTRVNDVSSVSLQVSASSQEISASSEEKYYWINQQKYLLLMYCLVEYNATNICYTNYKLYCTIIV